MFTWVSVMSVGLQEDERDSKVGMLTDFISRASGEKRNDTDGKYFVAARPSNALLAQSIVGCQ